MGKIGVPIWNVPGNHDTNNESPTDRYATQTYSRYYGPTDFSFNHGDTHWIGADNIDDGDEDRPSQGCVFNAQQLSWLRNDLKFVPKDKLIVIVTHCPLITYALDSNGERYSLGGNINTINLHELVEILKPFPRVYAIAGHDTSNSWKVQLNHTHGWATGSCRTHWPKCAETAGARAPAPSATRAPSTCRTATPTATT
jgi:3',5'-cyclic AMP phosphodiesterase CpdA